MKNTENKKLIIGLFIFIIVQSIILVILTKYSYEIVEQKNIYSFLKNLFIVDLAPEYLGALLNVLLIYIFFYFLGKSPDGIINGEDTNSQNNTLLLEINEKIKRLELITSESSKPSRIGSFASEIQGDWIEIFVNVQEIEVFSFCEISYEKDEDKIFFNGRTYDKMNKSVGQWESFMTNVDSANKSFSYLFTGSFNKDNIETKNLTDGKIVSRINIEYSRPGFGEFKFLKKVENQYQYATGKFWDESKSQQMQVELIRMTPEIINLLNSITEKDFVKKLSVAIKNRKKMIVV